MAVRIKAPDPERAARLYAARNSRTSSDIVSLGTKIAGAQAGKRASAQAQKRFDRTCKL